MSKKHFTALAARIAAIASPAGRQKAAEAVADVCKAQSSNFDRTRFLAACNAA